MLWVPTEMVCAEVIGSAVVGSSASGSLDWTRPSSRIVQTTTFGSNGPRPGGAPYPPPWGRGGPVSDANSANSQAANRSGRSGCSRRSGRLQQRRSRRWRRQQWPLQGRRGSTPCGRRGRAGCWDRSCFLEPIPGSANRHDADPGCRQLGAEPAELHVDRIRPERVRLVTPRVLGDGLAVHDGR